MKFKRILAIVTLAFSYMTSVFAGAVLDVQKSELNINQKHQRDYIPITNIGNETGTFIVQIKNVTDPKNTFTYTNADLKSLPIIISPILMLNFHAGANKRILVRKKGILEKSMKLQLVISEYKNPIGNTAKIDTDSAGIDVQGSIHYIATINLS